MNIHMLLIEMMLQPILKQTKIESMIIIIEDLRFKFTNRRTYIF